MFGMVSVWLPVMILVVVVPISIAATLQIAQVWRLPPDRGARDDVLLSVRQTAPGGWMMLVIPVALLGTFTLEVYQAVAIATVVGSIPLLWAQGWPPEATIRLRGRTLIVKGWFRRVLPMPAEHIYSLDDVEMLVFRGTEQLPLVELTLRDRNAERMLGHLACPPHVLDTLWARVQRIRDSGEDDEALRREQAMVRELDDPYTDGLNMNQLGAADRASRIMLGFCALLGAAAVLVIAGAVPLAFVSPPLALTLMIMAIGLSLAARPEDLRFELTPTQLSVDGWTGGLWPRRRRVTMSVEGLQLNWVGMGLTNGAPLYTVVLTPTNGSPVTLPSLQCEEAALMDLYTRLRAARTLGEAKIGQGRSEIPSTLEAMTSSARARETEK